MAYSVCSVILWIFIKVGSADTHSEIMSQAVERWLSDFSHRLPLTGH